MAKLTWDQKQYIVDFVKNMEDETHTKEFKSSFAGGNSGLSFGSIQGDIANNGIAKGAFDDIIYQSGLFTDTEVAAIKAIETLKGAAAETAFATYRGRIDQALSSENGQKLTQEMEVKLVDKLFSPDQGKGINDILELAQTQNIGGVYDPFSNPDYLKNLGTLAAWQNRTTGDLNI